MPNRVTRLTNRGTLLTGSASQRARIFGLMRYPKTAPNAARTGTSTISGLTKHRKKHSTEMSTKKVSMALWLLLVLFSCMGFTLWPIVTWQIAYFKENSRSVLARCFVSACQQEYATPIAGFSSVESHCKRSHCHTATLKRTRSTLSLWRSHRCCSFIDNDHTAESSAQIRSHREKQGAPIGANNLMIASIAVAHALILVTANTREFERVPNLHIENWLAS